MRNKSILFVTTLNVASNPRLRKEIQLAVGLFGTVDLIQFSLPGWSDVESDFFLKSNKDVIPVTLKSSKHYVYNWVLLKIVSFFYLIYRVNSIRDLAFRMDKKSILLNIKLKKWGKRYDWIIAHNPGAFYPAYKYATRTGCNLGFDIEDYHPGEFNDVRNSLRMKDLLAYLLPKATYCSFAAPLIQREFEKYIFHDSNNWFTVINGFPQSEFIQPTRTKSVRLRVIWFSQNITPGRGLEKFISVMGEFKDDIELHLVGELSDDNRKLLFNDSHDFMIHAPMKQMELHQFLSSFTVGLVTDPPINRNRELAITNKIIAYSQAGLYILSVSADGHDQFLKKSELNYQIIENDKREIRQALLYLISNYSTIVNNQYKNYDYAQINAWESINGKLTETWQN